MKKSTLALMVMGVVASASVHAAEVYNKDGNKLDVYGKVKAMHYISDDATKDGDQTYVRFGFKGVNYACNSVICTGYKALHTLNPAQSLSLYFSHFYFIRVVNMIVAH